MKLRSGRIVRYNPYTKRDINNLAKILSQLSLADEEEYKIVKEAKIFFRFLFYNTCKDLAHDVRLGEIRKSEGRRPYPEEIIFWKPDEDFWQEMFQDVWETMQEEVTPSEFLRAFYYFIKNEHPNILDKPQSFSRMKTEIAKYLQDLYQQNDSKRMIKFMQEQEQVKERTVPVADKKVYFTEITEYLSRNLMSPWSNFPQSDEWKQRFEGVKETACYISDDGCTVRRADYVGFSNPPSYFFDILETKERFSSCEKNPRKAFLLQKRLQGQKTIFT